MPRSLQGTEAGREQALRTVALIPIEFWRQPRSRHFGYYIELEAFGGVAICRTMIQIASVGSELPARMFCRSACRSVASATVIWRYGRLPPKSSLAM